MVDAWKRPSGSSAVMNQRIEPLDSLDDFPTPPWATRALLEHVLKPRGFVTYPQSCWEPACNSGIMAEQLRLYFHRVYATDIHHYGYPWLHAVQDFLGRDEPPARRIDWIVTNPPFRLALDFTLRALEVARFGVAIFARSNWIEGQERYRRLFRDRPPTVFAQFAERCPLVKGGWAPNASSATAYAWFVWIVVPAITQSRPFSEFMHIPDGLRTGLEFEHDRRRFAMKDPAPLLEDAE